MAQQSDNVLLPLRPGMDWALEGQADEILGAYRKTCVTNDEKTEFFTEAQMRLRWDKEVYNSFGIAEAGMYAGLYNRAFNPDFGQRPSRHQRSAD